MSREEIVVTTPPAFRFRTTLLSHGWVELQPFRHDASWTRLGRIHRLSDGTVVDLTVTADGEENLRVAVAGGRLTDAQRGELRAAVRHVFHLDLDLAPFYRRLRDEPRYTWVERAGAGRILRSPSVWEDLAKTLLTTNTTWAGTRGMVERLSALGDPFGDAPSRGGDHAFPTPERIAQLSVDELDARIRAGYRSPYLHELATEIAAGLDVEAWTAAELTSDELYGRLTALRGFGPYAAGNLLKLLGHYDELALDSVARSTFARVHGEGDKVTDREIEAHYEPYGEWRGLVLWMDVMHDWFVQNPGEQSPL